MITGNLFDIFDYIHSEYVDPHAVLYAYPGPRPPECVCEVSEVSECVTLVDSDCPQHGDEAVHLKAMLDAARNNALLSQADLVRRTAGAEARLRAQRARHRRSPNAPS
jgi:hypothetical protein